MVRFIIKPGVKAVAIKDGKDGGDATVVDITTSRETVFSEADVIIDPEGRFGVWSERSRTFGGDYARRGMMGFAFPSSAVCLIVEKKSVAEEDCPAIEVPVA